MIKITPNLNIKYSDLCLYVDFSSEFTLRDIIHATMNSSEINTTIMKQILNCNYITDYSLALTKDKDANREDKEEIEYLEVAWEGDISEYKKNVEFINTWSFYGVGKKGVLPTDIVIPIKQRKDYCIKYAIEFTPISELADLKVKVNPNMIIKDFRNMKETKKRKDIKKFLKEIDFTPSITLLELFYTIFHELSFFGSPEKTEDTKAMLNERVKEIDDAIKNGTIDKITVPYKDVKKRMNKLIKDLKEKGEENDL